ncbi:MAG: ATP-dependent RecD-like DNA helicase [Mollicutes bacterium]|nr:ATP-dependent RecD-like DNA helicase [Mollicutes bacterium]
MKNYIKGQYKRSIYKADNYVIGLFKVKDTNIEAMKEYINKTITFTGYFHELNEDENYLFYGEGIIHPRYGFQFQVNGYERIKPEDKEGIIAFLSSDLFSGVGEKLATRIVEALGEKALERILEDPSCLNLVPKLSTEKAEKIYHTLVQYEESHQTIVYLCELGFTMHDALKIYNTYYRNTITVLENNIYRIIDDIDNISFLTIDKLRQKFNIKDDDERRIKACIYYIMQELSFNQGDTYLIYEEILRGVIEYLKIIIDDSDFIIYLNELQLESKIVIENDKYYLKELYEAEINVARKIYKLVKIPSIKYQELDEYINALEKENNIKYNDKQKEAIIKALENNIVIITGGPGTGKTTIIKAIVKLYKELNNLSNNELNELVALLAPTGRASKRLSETTDMPAMTIHRFLKWNKELNQFGINEYNKANSKLVIIDEISMVDISLLDSLFKGLRNDIKLILVGDYHQLPSVGPGQVLKDLIDSNYIDTVYLKTLYRQDENSYIITLAHDINNETVDDRFLETFNDYQFIECNFQDVSSILESICKDLVDKGYNYKQVQFMAPMYRGENGINNLNKKLQNILNPKSPNKKEITYADTIFRENDKVLQLVNTPDENVFNGDVGVIEKIILANESSSGKNEIYINYDGNIVVFYPKDLVKIKHGFIISIHKSQGSEFDIVVMPIIHNYRRMLYRKLIYTGITRTKRKLILVGESEAFLIGINNKQEYLRKTDLLSKIKYNFS